VTNIGDEPVRPKGIEYLFINGKKVVSGGLADEAAMAGSGKILQKNSS